MSRLSSFSVLILEATGVYLLLLAAHGARWRLSLGPFYVVVGWITATMWWVSTTGAVVEWSGLIVTVGSVVFYTSLPLALLVVYVFDGPGPARVVMLTVAGMSLLVPGAVWLFSLQLPSVAQAMGPFAATFSVRGVFASVAASLTGFLALALIWESLNRGSPTALLLPRIYAALTGALLVDNAVYVTLAFGGSPRFSEIAAGGLLSRVALGVLVTPMAWAYLRLQLRAAVTAPERRSVFAILQPAYSLESRLREALDEAASSARSETVLRAEVEFLRRILDNVPVLLSLHRENGSIVWGNGTFRDVLGWEPDDAERAGLSEWMFPAGDDRSTLLALIHDASGQRCAVEARRADGKTVELQVMAVPLARDMRICIAENMSERNAAMADLRESQSHLRRLADKLRQATENERLALARVLHDDLGQLLTALRMNLSWLENHPVPADSSERLEDMAKILEQASATVRRISGDLRPPLFDEYGLADALERHVEEFRRRTGIDSTLEVRGEAASTRGSSAALALYRVAQEALVNVARHANARHVCVELDLSETCWKLHLRDDGRGIDEEDTRRSDNFGIRGMRERILALDGEFSIHGRPDEGTELRVAVHPRAAARE